MLDDSSLILNTLCGLPIALGCAHSGIINIINNVINMTGVDTIYGITGGTYPGFSADAQLEDTGAALKTYQIDQVIPVHYTGSTVATSLSHEFEKSAIFLMEGFSLNPNHTKSTHVRI